MKKLLLTIALTISSFAHTAYAAPISIGPFAFDDSATISSLTSASGVFSSTNNAGALTDQSLSTYFYGAPNSSGSVGFHFDTSLFNGADDDLALYFIRGNEDATSAVVDLTINGQTEQITASLFTTDSGDSFQAVINGIGFDILIATVNFDLFDLALNDSINDFVLSGLDSDERFALGAGFHTSASVTAVPLPAPLLLLLSGLAGLGLFGRKK